MAKRKTSKKRDAETRKKIKHLAETRTKLKQLKRRGLYSGDMRRKEPTRYAKNLVKKFEGFFEGSTKIVSVPRIKSKRSKGVREASKTAREIATKFERLMFSVGNKLMVRTAGEKVFYKPKTKSIITRRLRTTGVEETHEFVGIDLPDLNDDERYGIPLRRGKHPVEYLTRATKEEILALAEEYETREKNPYRGATGYIQIVYEGRKRKIPKAKTPVTIH